MKAPFSLSKKKSQTTQTVGPDGEELPEPETFDTGEQTHFAEELPILVEGDYSDPTVVQPVKKPNRLALVGAIGIPIVLLVLISMLFLSRGGSRKVEPTPTPQASGAAVEKGEIERRLDLVNQDVQKADPFQPELAFPPLNFDLNLEDATLRNSRTQPRR